MIVAPSKNGSWHLNNLINSCIEHGTNGHDVLIVDTGTTDIVSKKYLEQLKLKELPFKVTIIESTFGCYEAAAIVTAVRTFPDEEKFLFIQDSVVALSNEWITQFEDKLVDGVQAVAWVKFQPCLFCCGQHHLDYMDQICGHDDVPDSGFFGSIFLATGRAMREIDKSYTLLECHNKWQSEAWERLWAILFHLKGFKTEHIIWGFNPPKIHHGHYDHMKKHFGGRM